MDIETIVQKITSISVCPGCGGNYESFTCRYCKMENEELKELEKELREKVMAASLAVPREFTHLVEPYQSLLMLTNRKIGWLNEVLRSSTYLDFINAFSHGIDDKLFRQERLTEEEFSLMKQFVRNSFFPKNEQYKAYNFLFRLYFTEDFSLTEEEQRQFTCSFIESLIDHCTNLPYGKCSLITGTSSAIASQRGFQIFISDRMLDFMKNKDYLNYFETTFHELDHVLSEYQWKTGVITQFSLNQIKDNCLSSILPNYYKENYWYLSFEAQAFYGATTTAIEYLTSLKYPLTKKEHDVAAEKERVFGPRLFFNQRIYKGKTVELDDVFAEYVGINPSWLKQYPQLCMQYVLADDGKTVRRKSKEELLMDFQNKRYLENQNQQVWTQCYQELIRGETKRVENMATLK